MINIRKPSITFAITLSAIVLLFAACSKSGTETPKKVPDPPTPPVHVKEWVVSTLAGSSTAGFTDGDSTQAQFNNLQAIVADNNGNLFVGDVGNVSIRLVTYSGHVTTYAGKNLSSPDPAFGNIYGITRDTNGNLYTVEYNLIRKISSATVSSVFAGTLTSLVIDGTGTKAGFNIIQNMAMDKAGNIFIPDYDMHDNSILRKLTPDGVVSTVTLLDNTGIGDYSTPEIHYDHAITIDPSGNIYTTGAGNCMIKKTDPSGNVTSFAGTADLGFTDGKGTTARFGSIVGMTCDASGNLFVIDSINQAIREVNPDGTVTTIAGSGAMGYADGKGKKALFKFPFGITVDNAGVLYVTDSGNNRIRRLEYK